MLKVSDCEFYEDGLRAYFLSQCDWLGEYGSNRYSAG